MKLSPQLPAFVGMSGGQFNLTFDSDSFRFDVVFDDGLSSDISSLSGGEKVLVALSLAFAISQHFAGFWNPFFWTKA